MSTTVHSTSEPVLHWEGDCLRLPPEVTLHTVPGILQRVAGEKRCPEIVDFSDVTQADSAALAILLAWQAQREEALQIKALPEQLAVLLHLYDLEKVLVV